jgi:hypothetical protein
MLRKRKEVLLHITFYGLLACIILVVGREALVESRNRTTSDCNTTSRTPLSKPFASFARLHLPFTARPPQVVHLGTDVLPTSIQWTSALSTIGKVTVMHGKYSPGESPVFDTHLRHSDIHRYPIFVLDRPIVKGLWSKETALLAVLLHELAKSEGSRLSWLVWFDADTLVINPLIGVETFLPPDDLEGINLIVTEDWNGLNNGVFIMRVSAWSVNMLTDTLAYPTYRPDEDLPFTEQTAMERMIQDSRYTRNCIFVPPRWFNAYPRDEDETRTKYHVQRGDMMLHFAGVGDRSKMIRAFHDHVVAEREMWEIPAAETLLPGETADFWMNVRMQRQRRI